MHCLMEIFPSQKQASERFIKMNDHSIDSLQKCFALVLFLSLLVYMLCSQFASVLVWNVMTVPSSHRKFFTMNQMRENKFQKIAKNWNHSSLVFVFGIWVFEWWLFLVLFLLRMLVIQNDMNWRPKKSEQAPYTHTHTHWNHFNCCTIILHLYRFGKCNYDNRLTVKSIIFQLGHIHAHA